MKNKGVKIGLTSLVLAASDGPVGVLSDLKGRRIAVGAYDSPQATLIPLLLLHEAGLAVDRDVEVVPFDVLPGKHGDHVGGERDAVRAAARAQGMTYNRFIQGLNLAGVEVNRKILADLAVNDVAAFNSLVETAKAALPDDVNAPKAEASA